MANYVRSRIVVQNAPGFERYLGENGFDFNKVIPLPLPDYLPLDHDRDTWRIKNWGTSDNALRSYLRFSRQFAYGLWDVCFSTSWDAPIPVFEAIVKAFPESSIRLWTLDDGRTTAIEGYGERGKLVREYLHLDSPGVLRLQAQRVLGGG